MITAAFLDTNILIYATLQPDRRSDTARSLLARRSAVSVQVLNEFASVARRKLRRGWPEITQALGLICELIAPPLPITIDTHQAALKLAAATGYHFYDALIVASALEAGCDTLFSEDLQDGRVIAGRLTIRNAFTGDG